MIYNPISCQNITCNVRTIHLYLQCFNCLNECVFEFTCNEISDLFYVTNICVGLLYNALFKGRLSSRFMVADALVVVSTQSCLGHSVTSWHNFTPDFFPRSLSWLCYYMYTLCRVNYHYTLPRIYWLHFSGSIIKWFNWILPQSTNICKDKKCKYGKSGREYTNCFINKMNG